MRAKLILTAAVCVLLACSLTTPTLDLEEDLVIAPASYWMDAEIQSQYPGAEIWPPVGVERGVRLYRIFKHGGQPRVAVFEQGAEKWELADVIEIKITPTPAPTPAATPGAGREARVGKVLW